MVKIHKSYVVNEKRTVLGKDREEIDRHIESIANSIRSRLVGCGFSLPTISWEVLRYAHKKNKEPADFMGAEVLFMGDGSIDSSFSSLD